jgi:fused signal recognition particle receptor
MSFWNTLVDRFRGGAGEEIDWEPLLIEADLGLTLSDEWVRQLREAGLSRSPEKAEAWLREKMAALVRIPPPLPIRQKPEVILLVGVNGSGKTTTEQLEAWGARLGIPVTGAPSGTDPASVAVRAWLAAQEEGTDLLIIDTAGRQANKRNLLLELQKIKRSLQKKAETIPHHTWLVADGTTGGGVLHQTRDFHEAVGLTGLIVTKLDGSARGGMIPAVRAELGLPTYYLGQGERPEDLRRFEVKDFVENFFGR